MSRDKGKGEDEGMEGWSDGGKEGRSDDGVIYNNLRLM